MNYLGDYADNSTVYIYFSTHEADTGAPVAPSSAFEAEDVKIYKNGAAAEKTTTNGLTMTSPFDAITGLHQLAIDTSNDTGDAGFWAAGGEYTVVLVPDETVDGSAVLKVIGSFSLERSGAALALLKDGTYGLSALETLVDDLETRIGTPADLGGGATIAQNLSDIEAQTDDIGAAGAGLTAIPWNGAWDAEVESECTDALNNYDPPTNGEMEARTLVAANYATAAGQATIEGKIDTIDGIVDSILTDTAEIGAAGAGLTEAGGTGDQLTAIPWNGAWDAEVESECTDALNNYDPPTNGEMEARTLVAANYATAAGQATIEGKVDTVDGVVDAILLDTAEIGAAGAGLTEAGGTGDQLTAIPWNGAWDAEVESECTDALNNYDPPTKAEMDNAIDAIPTADENADALLKRDWTSVAGEASRSVLNALRFLRNKWTIIGGTLSVKEEDDATEAWNSALTTNAAADPIVESDPT